MAIPAIPTKKIVLPPKKVAIAPKAVEVAAEEEAVEEGDEAEVTEEGAEAEVTEEGAEGEVTEEGAEAEVTEEGEAEAEAEAEVEVAPVAVAKPKIGLPKVAVKAPVAVAAKAAVKAPVAVAAKVAVKAPVAVAAKVAVKAPVAVAAKVAVKAPVAVAAIAKKPAVIVKKVEKKPISSFKGGVGSIKKGSNLSSFGNKLSNSSKESFDIPIKIEDSVEKFSVPGQKPEAGGRITKEAFISLCSDILRKVTGKDVSKKDTETIVGVIETALFTVTEKWTINFAGCLFRNIPVQARVYPPLKSDFYTVVPDHREVRLRRHCNYAETAPLTVKNNDDGTPMSDKAGNFVFFSAEEKAAMKPTAEKAAE